MVELEPVVGKPIAEARNQLMQQAVASGAEFLFMLGDDVMCPGNMLTSMLTRMRNDPGLHLLTGVYWTKEWPTSPYLWRGMQKGPYLDWKAGELVQVDYAGCDALMIRLSSEIRALGPEWFSTDWRWEPDQEHPSQLATEDFYFYTKARVAGLALWADTGLQCIHEDRSSGIQFGLTDDMPQAGGAIPDLPEPGDGDLVRIADIGCGGSEPFWGHADRVSIARFDLDESKRPTFRCDIRQLPVPDQSFDVVHARHVLEHFGRAEVVDVLREWTRILRVGGELRISVPNAISAMRWLLAMDAGTEPVNPYPSWQIYGRQDDERDIHKNWFSVRRLTLLLERSLQCFDEVRVEEGDEGQNLYATAVKARHPTFYSLTPEWDRIAEQEGIAVPGMRSKTSPAADEPAGTAEHLADRRPDLVAAEDLVPIAASESGDGAEPSPDVPSLEGPARAPRGRPLPSGAEAVAVADGGAR